MNGGGWINMMGKMWWLLLSVLLSACTTLPNSNQVQTAEGRFSYYLAGTGQPTIIFESGLGDDMTTWQSVLATVQSQAQVLAYNRAGFSGSSSRNVERHGKVIVNELRALLQQLALPPPYILVGHSLGGGYVELFAKTHSDEVAGVVLVDPNSSKYPEQCKRAKLDFCDPPADVPWFMSLVLPTAVTGEIRGFAETHAQINASGAFPNVPLVVLSASGTREQGTLQQGTLNQGTAASLYTRMHREMAAQSECYKFIQCAYCSHYIHHDAPDLVAEAITWVIKQQ